MSKSSKNKAAKKAAEKAAEKAAAKAAKAAKKAGKNAGKKIAKDAAKAMGNAAQPAAVTTSTVEAAVVDEVPAAKATKAAKKEAGVTKRFSEVLLFQRTDRLSDISPDSTPGFKGDQEDGEDALEALSERLGELQERLFAESKGGGKRSVLLIIQGLDTAGKGGIMRHVVGAVDPQGVHITAFKSPTAEERAHDFLWRIGNALPGPGMIGVFDRSQYEDVLIVRVHDLVPPTEWKKRYAQINAFERKVAASGTRIIKVMLHISKDEQKARLTERLARADKHWKYRPGDVDERAHWDDYMEAYQTLLTRCSTLSAPWYVVPADNKWYARLAVQQLLLEALTDMDPVWPAATFDVAAEKARLADA